MYISTFVDTLIYLIHFMMYCMFRKYKGMYIFIQSYNGINVHKKEVKDMFVNITFFTQLVFSSSI